MWSVKNADWELVEENGVYMLKTSDSSVIISLSLKQLLSLDAIISETRRTKT